MFKVGEKYLLSYRIAIILTSSYIIFLFFLSSLPGSLLSISDSKIEIILSNLAHIPLYGFLAVLLFITYKNIMKSENSIYRLNRNVFATAMCIAVFDEINQSTVPGRSASLTDIILDATGVIIVLSLAYARFNIEKRKTD